MQIETNDKTGHIMRSKIRWNDDCEYQLYDSEETDSNGVFKPWLNAHVITTKILKAEKEYCVYEATMDGVSFKLTDTLRVIK